MSTSVLLACELNDRKLPQFVLIQENSGADASFLITSLVGSTLKYQQNGVILVCLHHVSQHYTTAAARLGMNVGMARDKGRIVITEPLADIGQNPLSSKYLTEPKDVMLDSLLQNIKEDVDKQLKDKENVTIIIDNVAAFVDLNYPKQMILQFFHKLIHMASDRVSIVLKINTSNLYADFVTSLEDYANSNYLITKMKSGEFHEVDGKIIYRKRTELINFQKQFCTKLVTKISKSSNPAKSVFGHKVFRFS